ncbi:PREDICTED: uncharacterized protein LOC105362262 [Ceratosolen solmsi marchali]|uniref:Uncharacterized protein LOC105362262 n=1 Tax=Ceratosolen solmsi marchali TaxID=326594 RepID=A0AAJ6YH39_9HYME|nr:PREDICTED: uncharacterized protein LOC105362262 [Ceratosolen solmsi marchali]
MNGGVIYLQQIDYLQMLRQLIEIHVEEYFTFRANFTEREQKLMLSYLITKRKVAVGASRITWKEIHEDGYLKNRSTESLRNNFRRVILPKIHTFGLPQHILQQFLKLN